MKKTRLPSRLLACGILLLANGPVLMARDSALIIDHSCANVRAIPEESLQKARETLHIGYGHTSHGSQLITGMDKLGPWAASVNLPTAALLSWTKGDKGFDLRDQPFSGANDLGNPNRTAWADASRAYLKKNPEVNVIMWSWCGQVGSATPEEIDTYLKLMTDLEKEFPSVKFVYMTGHLDGRGKQGGVFKNNEKIRDYCKKNGKILYDFADIESWDPDGKVDYNELSASDNCDYKSADGTKANWAEDWQKKNPGQWYSCSSAHSKALNANQKAFAAWWLFARLAGWNGK